MTKIKIYTFENCPYCANLERFLSERKISFKRIDVYKEKNNLPGFFKRGEEIEVPIIEINGKIIKGFNKEEIKKVLKIDK